MSQLSSPSVLLASIDGWQKVGGCGGWPQSMPCYFCLQQQQPWRPAMEAGRAKDCPTWRHRLSTQTNTALPGQVTKESESLDTDFSPSSDGSLGPASRRQVLLQNVLDCRPHHLFTRSSRMSGCVRRETCDSHRRGFLLTAKAGAKKSGHMRRREGNFAVVTRDDRFRAQTQQHYPRAAVH